MVGVLELYAVVRAAGHVEHAIVTRRRSVPMRLLLFLGLAHDEGFNVGMVDVEHHCIFAARLVFPPLLWFTMPLAMNECVPGTVKS